MKALRFVLLIVGIACTVVFLSVNYTRTLTYDNDVRELRIGFEPSPWVKREVRDGFASSELNLLSWSSAFALVAAASLGGYGRLRQTRQGNTAIRAERADFDVT